MTEKGNNVQTTKFKFSRHLVTELLFLWGRIIVLHIPSQYDIHFLLSWPICQTISNRIRGSIGISIKVNVILISSEGWNSWLAIVFSLINLCVAIEATPISLYVSKEKWGTCFNIGKRAFQTLKQRSITFLNKEWR